MMVVFAWKRRTLWNISWLLIDFCRAYKTNQYSLLLEKEKTLNKQHAYACFFDCSPPAVFCLHLVMIMVVVYVVRIVSPPAEELWLLISPLLIFFEKHDFYKCKMTSTDMFLLWYGFYFASDLYMNLWWFRPSPNALKWFGMTLNRKNFLELCHSWPI